MAPPLGRPPSRRSTPAQPETTLAEGWHAGKRGDAPQRGGDTARRVDPRVASNVYRHDVLDLWGECVVKPRVQGEAYVVRSLDDFVVCCQLRADALRMQEACAHGWESVV